MDYFCYISQTKVDALLANLESTVSETWTESTIDESRSDLSAEGGLNVGGIFSLFKGGVSYGNKGSVQFGREVKRQYLEKLQRVLEAALVAPGIEKLEPALDQGVLSGLYYHYTGLFRAEGLDETAKVQTVTIESRVKDRDCVQLDCSLRFFSQSTDPQGSFILHSSNARFFKGKIPLQFETVFILLHHSSGVIVGTPLFLKLHAEATGVYVEL